MIIVIMICINMNLIKHCPMLDDVHIDTIIGIDDHFYVIIIPIEFIARMKTLLLIIVILMMISSTFCESLDKLTPEKMNKKAGQIEMAMFVVDQLVGILKGVCLEMKNPHKQAEMKDKIDGGSNKTIECMT